MVRADYHVHSERSYDSAAAPAAILERAVAAGIGVLCVTDHDAIDGAARIAAMRCPEVRIVVGCEFTAEDGSHVIGLGLRDMIAERRIPALLEEIKLQGATVLLPHPFRRGSGVFRNELGRSEEFVREVLSRADLVECFNGRDTWVNNERNRRLVLEHGLCAVAGSDAHRADEIGSVFVETDGDVRAEDPVPRAIWFPPQPPSIENPLKRAAMELYHRHERRLPVAVRKAYRNARTLLARDGPPAGVPRRQYEVLPAVHCAASAGGASAGEGSAVREEGDRSRGVRAPPRDAGAAAGRDRDRGQGELPR